MTRLGAWLLASGLSLASIAAHAELRLVLDARTLDAEQRAASQALLDEAMAALPPRLVQSLDREVRVQWRDNLPEQAYGRAGGKRLELNRRLLPALTDGSAAEEKTNRPHGTVRRELLATVIHEVAHLYDRARLWSPDQHLLQGHCRQRASNLGQIGLPDDCRGQTDRRFTLSDDPRLLDLAGWPQRVGKRGLREQDNAQLARSPDPYELTSPLEFVAVNLEYFLLDPSYACRRPSLHRYFSEHFGWAPEPADCTPGYPFLNAGREFGRTPLLSLDPARVYEVDYLFAEANDAWVSRWGHSMLRLVICAPGREPGPACRLDLDHHLVLSFRAFVDDVQLSSWDGLTGVYPSRLFILPLGQVIDEYTKVELRGLASVPLKLHPQEIRQLVERSAELHWSYDGDYYFLSNNCAVETGRLLEGHGVGDGGAGGGWDRDRLGHRSRRQDGDTVAGAKAAARRGRQDFPRTFQAGDEGRLLAFLVFSARLQKIGEVQRRCAQPDQNPVRSRVRRGLPFDDRIIPQLSDHGDSNFVQTDCRGSFRQILHPLIWAGQQRWQTCLFGQERGR